MDMSQPAIQQGYLKRIFPLLVLLAFTAAAPGMHAQMAPHTQVHDSSVLKPPPGAKVAMVEFDDM
jgi:hypothetical protein